MRSGGAAKPRREHRGCTCKPTSRRRPSSTTSSRWLSAVDHKAGGHGGVAPAPHVDAVSCSFCISYDLSSVGIFLQLERTAAGPFGPVGPHRAKLQPVRFRETGPQVTSVRSGPGQLRPVQSEARSGTGPARTVSTLTGFPSLDSTRGSRLGWPPPRIVPHRRTPLRFSPRSPRTSCTPRCRPAPPTSSPPCRGRARSPSALSAASSSSPSPGDPS
ncbi:uncharacterized protein DKFZp434B061-like [Hordeum vulgare subsp. vulgare]|uniref:uncharacterized protein DKFZp434B061-like n=1 Tax=Hordeum vulgare subsp. vulgare TaxID=112509 RepID=UPI001D1A4DA5|nr:uncharacterized protein DKFZp434B061-like [Hordeum vulgare subsp. vulgare]